LKALEGIIQDQLQIAIELEFLWVRGLEAGAVGIN
jgi:hypothetical protein